jgi:spermidine synthase
MDSPSSHSLGTDQTEASRPVLIRSELILLGVTVFASGFVVMTLELAASRLYAPFFGSSIYVWGGLIGVALIALAVGYAIGGWVADRKQDGTVLYSALLSSGLYQMLMLFSVPFLLPRIAGVESLQGSLLATLIIFAIPITTLAMSNPIATRLIAPRNRVGAASGTVSTLSTLGSILGVFGTSFFLVPRFGTHTTLMLATISTVVLGTVGIAHRRLAASLVLLTLPLMSLAPHPAALPGDIWAQESAYNLVRVRRTGDRLHLVFNNDWAIQTIRKDASLWTGTYYDLFSLGPVLVPTQRVLVLGLGGGSSIAATRFTASQAEFDALEIDAVVVTAAERFFGLDADAVNLRVHVADARPWLAQNNILYDIIQVDAYQGGPYPPFYLLTDEFFRLLRERVNTTGLVMFNLWDASSDKGLLLTVSATLRRVFRSLSVIEMGGGTYMLLAFPTERTVETLRSQLLGVTEPADIIPLARRAAAALTNLVPPLGTPILTDDHAPVEELVRRSIFSAFRRDEPLHR